MKIIGCDFHAGFQQAAMLDPRSGGGVRLGCLAQFPVQPHRQLSCDSHFGHPTIAAAEPQSLIVSPQFRIKFGGGLCGLDQ